jgi:GTP pyrophosphokinase
MIRKAFDVSVAHKTSVENRAKPIFSIHCRGKIVASEIGLGASIAALLHDVVEDTPTTVKT